MYNLKQRRFARQPFNRGFLRERPAFAQRTTVYPGGLLDLAFDLQAAAVAAPGRYEGDVKRESDGALFKRRIEIDAPAGNRQPIRIYDVVGGGLPPTPQWAGDALLLGSSLLLFAGTDSVADRKFASLVLGNFMFSFSLSTYHDGRPDVKLAGVLRKV